PLRRRIQCGHQQAKSFSTSDALGERRLPWTSHRRKHLPIAPPQLPPLHQSFPLVGRTRRARRRALSHSPCAATTKVLRAPIHHLIRRAAPGGTSCPVGSPRSIQDARASSTSGRCATSLKYPACRSVSPTSPSTYSSPTAAPLPYAPPDRNTQQMRLPAQHAPIDGVRAYQPSPVIRRCPALR